MKSKTTKKSNGHQRYYRNFSIQRSFIQFSEISQPCWLAVMWSQCSQTGMSSMKGHHHHSYGLSTLLKERMEVKRNQVLCLLEQTSPLNDTKTFHKKASEMSPHVMLCSLYTMPTQLVTSLGINNMESRVFFFFFQKNTQCVFIYLRYNEQTSILQDPLTGQPVGYRYCMPHLCFRPHLSQRRGSSLRDIDDGFPPSSKSQESQ